jgi:oligopeptide transport system substrate-binding protein
MHALDRAAVAVSAVLLAAVLILSGCGSAGTAGPGASAVDAPKTGGTYNFPLHADPVSIEPLNAQEPEGMQVAHQVFEGLVKWQINDGGVMVAAPGIAESWQTTDAQTWTFTLKKGVTFQPPVGREVTAQDFVDSWNRVTDPKNHSLVSYILAPIEGCDDDGYQVDPGMGLSGVRALDASTLEVKLRYPFADLPMILGHTVAAVTPVDYIEKVGEKKYGQRPVGTGPYVVGSWRKRRSIQLTRSAGYWDADNAGWVAAISMPVIPETDNMWLEFQAGDLDCSRVPPGQVEAAATLPQVAAGEWTAAAWPDPAVGFVGINMRDADLGDDLQLRRALSQSADAEAVCSAAGEGVPLQASGYVPVGIAGHRDAQNPYPYDPEQATAIVAGLGGAPRLAYWYTTSAPAKEIAEILQTGWASAGIDIEPSDFDGPVLFDGLSRGDSGSGAQLFAVGYIADYPSMGDFLYPLFYSEQSRSGSFTGYSNAAVDELLLQARGTQDAQQRYNLYAQAEKLILSDMPAIPLYYYRDFLVTNNRIGGFARDPMGFVDMWDVWVK